MSLSLPPAGLNTYLITSTTLIRTCTVVRTVGGRIAVGVEAASRRVYSIVALPDERETKEIMSAFRRVDIPQFQDLCSRASCTERTLCVYDSG